MPSARAPALSTAFISDPGLADGDVLLLPCPTPGGKPTLPALGLLPGMGSGRHPHGKAALDHGFSDVVNNSRLSELARHWSGGSDVGTIDDVLVAVNGRCRRIAIVSLGKSTTPTMDAVRSAAAAAARWCMRHKLQRQVVAIEPLAPSRNLPLLQAWTEATVLAGFRYHKLKSRPGSDRESPPRSIAFLSPVAASTADAAALRRAATIAECVNIARHLGHEPPNIINPLTLATEAARLAKQFGLKCLVLNDRQMAALKMNALLAVGGGSATKPRLIVLEHGGKRASDPPIALVGKAVTLDTGGYSIKPADGIPDMKYDKCGGMAVIGLMCAAARLKFPRRIIGVIAAAENMISGEAYRPGDILTAMNGKTIEVLNTDAEGRLVLADALTWVQRVHKPEIIIDLATLTGACTVALGHHAAALYANDDKLAAALSDSGMATGDKLWRMPLWPEYRKQIEGVDGDLKNTGGRPAGSITAAMFLREFIENGTPWAHLDIAGVANLEKDTPMCPKGATGFGVRLLAHYLGI